MKKITVFSIIFLCLLSFGYSDNIRYFSNVEKLRIRETPDMNGKTLGYLAMNEEITFLNDTSTRLFTVDNDVMQFNEPFIKIKTKSGITGWVYRGFVRTEETIEGYNITTTSFGKINSPYVKRLFFVNKSKTWCAQVLFKNEDMDADFYDYTLVVNGKKIPGIYENDQEMLMSSYDGNAYCCYSKNKMFLVNGIELKKYDAILDPYFIDKSKYVFLGNFGGNSSGDPRGGAPYEITGGKTFLVVNDVIGKGYDEIPEYRINKTGQTIAYTARENNNWYVVMNNQEVRKFDRIEKFQYIENINAFFYIGYDLTQGKAYVCLNKDTLKTITITKDTRLEQVLYDTDSKNIYYILHSGEMYSHDESPYSPTEDYRYVGGKWYVYKNDELLQTFDHIKGQVMLKNGKFAYIAGNKGKLIDREEIGKDYEGGEWYFVYDNQMKKHDNEISWFNVDDHGNYLLYFRQPTSDWIVNIRGMYELDNINYVINNDENFQDNYFIQGLRNSTNIVIFHNGTNINYTYTSSSSNYYWNQFVFIKNDGLGGRFVEKTKLFDDTGCEYLESSGDKKKILMIGKKDKKNIVYINETKLISGYEKYYYPVYNDIMKAFYILAEQNGSLKQIEITRVD